MSLSNTFACSIQATKIGNHLTSIESNNYDSNTSVNQAKNAQIVEDPVCETRTATAQCGEETVEFSHKACAMNSTLAASAAQRGADALATAYMYVCASN